MWSTYGFYKELHASSYIVVLVCFISWQNIRYVCCPHCMRKHIFIKGFTYNILLSNFLWPFIILPWSIIQLIRSYNKGHSL